MALVIKDTKLINKLTYKQEHQEAKQEIKREIKREVKHEDDGIMLAMVGDIIALDKRVASLEKEKVITATIKRDNLGNMKTVTIEQQGNIVATAVIERRQDNKISTMTITKTGAK